MPDEDIMDRLKEIDDDEILGEEVSFDDLDFEGLDDMDSPAAAPVAQVVAPPAPLAEASSGEVGSEKPTAVRKKSRTKSSKPKTASPPDPPPDPPPDDAIPPARAETSVTEAEEVIVRAKVLRIVADRVIIEPGSNISFSP